MIKRSVTLRDFVAELTDKNLNDFPLNAPSEHKVDTLLKKLEELKAVVVKL